MINSLLQEVIKKNPGENEFHQAVKETIMSIAPLLEKNPKYRNLKILERIIEPERIIIFHVPWIDDRGEVQINRGFRIEMNSTLGPYKGGLRFHPSVNLGIFKFLALQQVFKNSLTTLSLGGAQGGANFDPKGKTDLEVMRFCQSFMIELVKHIGPNTDIPGGDIGVGSREIGYLFGQYKRLQNEFSGVITGKGLNWGGSHLRLGASGYSVVFFAESMLNVYGKSIKDKLCLVSGSGNVAQHVVKKINQMGGKCITLSDSNGTVHDPEGINNEKLLFVMQLKNIKRGRIKEYAEKFNCEYFEGQTPWHIVCDVAFPCATQNELNKKDAEMLVNNGCMCICEGANMPCSLEAINLFQEKKISFAPGIAANAGGVSVSSLEMSQNSMWLQWSEQEVESHLQQIMIKIHDSCVTYGTEPNGYINYLKGANVAGFIRIADAMIEQGIV